MISTKSLLKEIANTKARINHIKERKEALKASLLSEGLIDMLVDAILGPFIHMDAVKMRNTPEYKAAMNKIKEMDALQKKLKKKAEKLQAEYDKAEAKQLAALNTKRSQSTKPLK